MTNAPTSTAVPRDELAWSHRFAALGERFCVPMVPTALPQPYWVGHSDAVAELLGLARDWRDSGYWLRVFAGNAVPAGSKPVASVYSGHQFGVWAGQLGDGRAILLGEINGLELQIKGAGRTPFSRMGDGRAVLRSSIREFLCSEAIHALGIPGTRALCVIGSDAPVYRETPETAAVVTRVAPSLVRFGHFEHFAHSGQLHELKTLADYVIDRFYPACRTTEHWGGNPYLAMLAEVTRCTAELLAHWQSVGFCHGVMNTDNMSILGLTIDYGPFQFMDAFDPRHICNHSDHQGRYAFGRQPQVAWWNLFCLGQALLPLTENQDRTVAALETWQVLYPQAYARRMTAKLGFSQPDATHLQLLGDLLTLMAADRVDYTIFWRRLSHWAVRADMADATVRDLFVNRYAIDAWLAGYTAQIRAPKSTHNATTMLRNNPKYVLRNHLVELAIRAARAKDFSEVNTLLKVLSHPFDEQPAFDHLANFPPDWANKLAISCSS